jgi:hypothetical protein
MTDRDGIGIDLGFECDPSAVAFPIDFHARSFPAR